MLKNSGLKVSGLNIKIGNKQILNNISFDIDFGKSVGFIGNNGAGKTTTIKVLAGINEPDSGIIQYDGKDVFQMKKDNSVGYLPEKTYFPSYLTGEEFIKFICDINEIEFNAQKIDLFFKELGIFDSKKEKIKSYSKGMMQRLGFISILVNEKIKYLLLDEPMSGLDHVGQIETIEIIKKLKLRGLTILITSHHMNEIEEICDEIIFIKNGNIIDKRAVKEILNKYKDLKSYYLDMSKKEI